MASDLSEIFAAKSVWCGWESKYEHIYDEYKKISIHKPTDIHRDAQGQTHTHTHTLRKRKRTRRERREERKRKVLEAFTSWTGWAE